MTKALWAALAAGHLTWSLQLLVSYAIAAAECGASGSGAGLAPLRHGLTLAALAASAAAVAVGVRRERGGVGADGEAVFAARLAVALSVLFGFAIVLVGAVGAVVSAC